MSCQRFTLGDGTRGFLCGPDRRGVFGPWSWEMSFGLQWYWMGRTRFERALFPGPWSPLWLIFYAQRGNK